MRGIQQRDWRGVVSIMRRGKNMIDISLGPRLGLPAEHNHAERLGG